MPPFFLVRAPTIYCIYIILVTVVPVSCFNESGWYLGINIWAVFTSTTQVRRLRVDAARPFHLNAQADCLLSSFGRVYNDTSYITKEYGAMTLINCHVYG